MASTEFNFKPPVFYENGCITIEPNFPDSGPLNNILAIARTSEIPALLQEIGELTLEEDNSIQYYHLQSNQPVWVGRPGNEIFDCIFLDEQEIQRHPNIFYLMCELRELILRRKKNSDSSKSAFEFYMSKAKEAKEAKEAKRTYTLGFNSNPQQTSIQTAAMSDEQIKDPSTLANITRLAALITTHLMKEYIPKQVLDLLEKQADVDVPVTMGHESNRYTTSLQLNISDPTESVLKISLGDGGDLHIDKHDSPRNYTVLLSLSNLPEGYWPGRTLLADLRLYTVLAPMTALIFKGCRSHMSLGPRYAALSKRQPYQPSAEIPRLSSQDFIFARLTTINYPRNTVLLHTCSKIRQATPQKLRGEQNLESNFPEALPVTLAAFGTRENQQRFQAQFFTLNRVRHARQDPSIYIPTADFIAHMFSYIEKGVLKSPDVAAIQRVIDANMESPENQQHKSDFVAFDKLCRSTMSIPSFWRGSRGGQVVWVETPGASLKGYDPTQPIKRNDPADNCKAFIYEEFGPNPYLCDHCNKRFFKMTALKNHHDSQHPDWEWGGGVYPSLDPDYVKPAEISMEHAAETAMDDNQAEEKPARGKTAGGKAAASKGGNKKRKL